MSIPICWNHPWGRPILVADFKRSLRAERKVADRKARSLKDCSTTLGRVSLLWLVMVGLGARAGDLLSDYQSSPAQSTYGLVSRVEFSTGLVELAPRLLVQSPAGTM